MKKKHKHEPDTTMSEVCENCGHGTTYCKNCEDVQYKTEDGELTWKRINSH